MSSTSHHSKTAQFRLAGGPSATGNDRTERAAVAALVRRLNAAADDTLQPPSADADAAASDELMPPDASAPDPAALAPGVDGAPSPALASGAGGSQDVAQLLQQCYDLLRQIADNTAHPTALTSP